MQFCLNFLIFTVSLDVQWLSSNCLYPVLHPYSLSEWLGPPPYNFSWSSVNLMINDQGQLYQMPHSSFHPVFKHPNSFSPLNLNAHPIPWLHIFQHFLMYIFQFALLTFPFPFSMLLVTHDNPSPFPFFISIKALFTSVSVIFLLGLPLYQPPSIAKLLQPLMASSNKLTSHVSKSNKIPGRVVVVVNSWHHVV